MSPKNTGTQLISSRKQIFARDQSLEMNSTNSVKHEEVKVGNVVPSEAKKKTQNAGRAGIYGTEFQVGLLTLVLLKVKLLGMSDWILSTENPEAGKFDDIVLECSDGVILLQAKHRVRKVFPYMELFSNDPKSDFSLAKYFISYVQIKSAFRINFIGICTNANVQAEKNKNPEEYLESHEVDCDSVLYYEGQDCRFYKLKQSVLSYLKKICMLCNKKLSTKGMGIPEEQINEQNLLDFLKHFRIYYNFPGDADLSRVIEDLWSRMKFFYPTSSSDIYNKINKWFKQGDNYLGEHLKDTETKAMLVEINSDKYCQVLNQHKISFEQDNFHFSKKKKVFHVITQVGYLLPTIKICYSLRKENIESKSLYLNPDIDFNSKQEVIDAFYLPYYEFLVLIQHRITQEDILKTMCNKLQNLLGKYENKKIILVCERNDILAKRIKEGVDYEEIDGQLTFKDLSQKTQNELLTYRNIIFQGTQFSLEELFSFQTSVDYEKAINTDLLLLEKLVQGEKIRVGSLVEPLDSLTEFCYIPRKFERNKKSAVEEKDIIDEEDIFVADEKLIVISDTAGMGKTTLLAKLARTIKEKDPHLWIIHVQLRDTTRILMKVKDKDSVATLEFLHSHVKTEFEKYIFSLEGRVVLILDGLNEISQDECSDYAEQILNLISQCREATNFIKIFVATRPDITDRLYNKLQVNSYRLNKFSEEDQTEFLTKYWEYSLALDTTHINKCKRYAEALIEKMRYWTSADHRLEKNMATVPLHLRMVAEIFKNSTEEWRGSKEFIFENDEDPELPTKVDISTLYRLFVEKKREIFMDKENPEGRVGNSQAHNYIFKKCLSWYRTLALESIFSNKIRALFSDYNQRDADLDSYMLKMGIVQKSDKQFHFVHQTFAEYFVAKSLLKELVENRNDTLIQFFIDKILTHPRFDVIRSFLNSLLREDTAHLSSNIFQDYDAACNLKLIHILAQDGCVQILKFILKCMDFKNTNKSVSSADLDKPGNTFKNLQRLVKLGGVNIRNASGKTPLYYAAGEGHLDMVKFLVEHDASITCEESRLKKSCPIYIAMFSGHLDVVKFLAEQPGVAPSDWGGTKTVKSAVDFNQTKIGSYLLDRVWDNGVDFKDELIPITAAHLGKLPIIKDTVKRGLHKHRWHILLHIAALKSHVDIIKYLSEQGVDVKSLDSKGGSALHSACSKHFSLPVGKLLLDTGVDVNIKNRYGQMALHNAARRDDLNTVEFLVKNNADIFITDNDDRTAMWIAAQYGNLKIVNYLKESGDNIHSVDRNGRTILHSAVVGNKLKLVEFFVHEGVNIHVKDSNGCTALHEAAWRGNLDIVRFLVSKNADVKVKDLSGRTPLLVAAEKGHSDVVAFLIGQVDDKYSEEALAILSKKENELRMEDLRTCFRRLAQL